MQKFLRKFVMMALLLVPWVTQAQPWTVTIAPSPLDESMGSVFFVGHDGSTLTVNDGDEVTIYAVSQYGYKLGTWCEADVVTPYVHNGTTIVSEDGLGGHYVTTVGGNDYPAIKLTVSSDMTVIAKFDFRYFDVSDTSNLVTGNPTDAAFTVNLNPAPHGIRYNDDAILRPVASAEHMHFVRWSDGNTDNPRTVTVTAPVSYAAIYEINTYTITLQGQPAPHDAAYTSLDLDATGGEYEYNTNATIGVTGFDAAHYNWDGWYYDDGVNPIYKLPGVTYPAGGDADGNHDFTVIGDSTLIAVYTPKNFNITATAGANGLVEITGTPVATETEAGAYLTQKTLTAHPNTGYHFVNWTSALGTKFTDNPLTVDVLGDSTYTANFAIDTFDVELLAALPSEITYRIYNDSDQDTLRFVYGENVNFQFTVDPVGSYKVTGVDWDNGTNNVNAVTGTDQDGKTFAPLGTIAANPTHTITPIFAAQPHTITATSYNIYQGEIKVNDGTWKETENITDNYGTTVTLTARVLPSLESYVEFSCWVNYNTDDTIAMGVGNESITVKVGASDITYLAHFKLKEFYVHLDPATEHGSIQLTGNHTKEGGVDPDSAYYYFGELAEVAPVAAEHWVFDKWSDDVTDNPRFIDINKDTLLMPVFVRDSHLINVAIDDAAHGAVAVNGVGAEQITAVQVRQMHDNTVTLVATPSDITKFVFKEWRSEHGTVFAGTTDAGTGVNTLEITVDDDSTYTAYWDTVAYEVTTYVVDDANATSDKGEATPVSLSVKYASTFDIDAINPATGYEFKEWRAHSTHAQVATTASVTDIVMPNADTAFDAVFTPITYTIIAHAQFPFDGTPVPSDYSAVDVEYGAWIDGSILASKDIDFETGYVLTALDTSAYSGYHFVKWTNDQGDEYTDSVLTVAAGLYASNVEWTAIFEPNIYNIALHGQVLDAVDYGVNDTIMGKAVANTTSAPYNTFITMDVVPGSDIEAQPKDGYYVDAWVKTTNIGTFVDTMLSRHMNGDVPPLPYNYLITGHLNVKVVFNYNDITVDTAVVDSVRFVLYPDITLDPDYPNLPTYPEHDPYVTVPPTAPFGTIGMGEVDGPVGVLKYSSIVTYTATPNTGFHFKGWNDGKTANPRQDTLHENTIFAAIFAIDTHNVVINFAETTRPGIATGNGTYRYAYNDLVDPATLITIADPVNYTLSGFYEGATYHALPWSFNLGTADVTLIAKFDTTEYTVTTAVDDPEHGLGPADVAGTVTPTYDVYYLNQANLTATANTGFHFVKWLNNLDATEYTTATINPVVMEDVTWTAYFERNLDTISVTDDGHSSATVAIVLPNTVEPLDDQINDTAVSVKYMNHASLTAVADYGYTWSHWTNNVNAATSTANPYDYTFDANQNILFTSNVTPNHHNLTILPDYAVRGNIAFGNEAFGYDPVVKDVVFDQEYTIKAQANYGYQFKQWVHVNAGGIVGNDTVVSTDADFTFTAWIDEDYTFRAEFQYDTFPVTIHLTNNTVDLGYAHAVVDDTIGWYYYGTLAHITFDGNVEDNECHYTELRDANGNPITPAGLNTTGAPLQVVLDTAVLGPIELTAVFDTNTYDLIIHTVPTAYGTATIDNTNTGTDPYGTYAYKHKIRIDATPADHRIFLGWSDDALGTNIISTNNPDTIQLLTNTILYAQFALDTHDVTVAVHADCDGMGTVAPTTIHTWHGNTVDVTATPATGYDFDKWVSLNGTEFTGTDNGDGTNTLSITVDGDSTFYAVFKHELYSVDISIKYPYEEMGKVVLTQYRPTDTIFDTAYNVAPLHITGIPSFTHVKFEPVPEYGYRFVQWNNGETNATLDFNIYQDTALEAEFEYQPWSLTTEANVTERGTTTGDGVYSYGTLVEIVATPATGYHFQKWIEAIQDPVNGGYVPTGAFYTNATQNVTVSADGMLFTAIFVRDTVLDAVTACDQYVWEGNTYTASDVDTMTLTDEFGYDSVVVNTITINYSVVNNLANMVVCDSYTWTDGDNQTYTTTGIYPYVIAGGAANACDSTTNLDLTVNYSNTGVDNQVHCETYTWIDGITYTESNTTATHVLTGANAVGCDSTVTLNLTINNPVHLAVSETSCETFTWLTGNGMTYTASGDYTYQHTDANGCNQVDTLHLTINNPVHTAITEDVCDSYTWTAGNGTVYTTSGDYTYAHADANGCNQVDTLHLTVRYSNSSSFAATACDSYTWTEANMTETTTGTYQHVFTNAAGCDSTVTLHLTVNYSTAATDVHDVCDSYTWIDGNTYTANNTTAQHTLINAVGCDSVVTLDLTVRYSTEGTDVQDHCDTYTWINGVTYTASNTTATHVLTGANAVGCDSTVTLNLTIRYSDVVTANPVTACDSYTWEGTTYTTTGNYTKTLTNQAGCDSVVTLPLTVNYHSYGTDVQDVCDQLTWIDGNTYTANNTTAQFTLTNANSVGCDSIVTLNLNVRYSNEGEDTQVSCDSYTWEGTTYTVSGDYVKVLAGRNAVGCDSTATLHLTVNYSNTGADVQNVCDVYTWNNIDYNTTGTYYQTLTNVDGCDSVVTLLLTVRYSNTGVDAAVACDSYTWNDQTYTVSGTYVQTLTNAAGCDSTVTMTLTVNYSDAETVTEDVCDTYTWTTGNGETYTESGSYIYNTTTVNGCDSTVTLDLTVRYSTHNVLDTMICKWHFDTPFNWHGIQCAYTDTYNYNYTNAVNCPSTDTLHLVINEHKAVTDVQNVCDSYTWTSGSGLTYTTSGEYPVTLQTSAGCDSIVTLALTVRYHSEATVNRTACDSYTWTVGEETVGTYTNTGLYTYTIQNTQLCDSIITLDLTVNYSNIGEPDFQTACVSYNWNGDNLTTSGSYSQTLTNIYGCDSIANLMLTINQPVHATVAATACDSYTWTNGDNQTYTTTGNYVYTITNGAANGCDSIVTLNLTVNYASEANIAATACDSYLWNINGQTYTATGDYVAVITNAAGCDSTVTLALTVNQSKTAEETASECVSYTWNNQTYTNSGDYTYLTTGSNGCDSTTTLHLTIKQPTTETISDVACVSYTWNNQNIYASGVYTYETIGSNGCDSTATLLLTINQPAHATVSAVACVSYTWTANNQTYTGSGNYDYTIAGGAANGCDSITTLALIINQPTSATVSETACDSYAWALNGQTYTASGLYTTTLNNVNGCDSTVTLALTIKNSKTASVYASACEQYTWNNQTYAASGDYPYSTTASNGCDSTITLHLTINQPTNATINESACVSYSWFGTTYTQSGTYTYTLVGGNHNGCDSIQTLNLTIKQPVTASVAAQACDSYTWNNQTYTNSGNYSYTVANGAANGCDSIVTLNLTINPSVTSNVQATSCVSYNWIDGNTYTQSGIYTVVLTTRNGCDSTVNLSLTINQPVTATVSATSCVSYTWNNQTYTASGNYTYTTTGANGCDSVTTLNLTINQPTTATVFETACSSYDWNNTTYTTSGAYQFTTTNANGCDSTVTLVLTVNYPTFDTNTVVANGNYTWAVDGNTYTTSGTYTFTSTGANGCDYTQVLQLTVNPTYHVQIASNNLAWGYVSPVDTNVATGTSITAIATALPGAHFVAWMNGADTVSHNTVYTFTVVNDLILTAVFAADPVYLTVTVVIDSNYMGYVQADNMVLNSTLGQYTGQYVQGTDLELVAMANSGFRFVRWSNGQSDPTINITVSNDVTLHAIFERIPVVAIEETEAEEAVIYSVERTIYVRGAEGMDVYVYDVNGRMMDRQMNAADAIEFRMPATGVYLVKVGNAPAKRVMVVR